MSVVRWVATMSEPDRPAARRDATTTPWVPLTARPRSSAVADLPTERFARLLTGLPDTGELEALYRADSRPRRAGVADRGAGVADRGASRRALGWLLTIGGIVGLLVSLTRAGENSGLVDLVPLCEAGPRVGCELPPVTAWAPILALLGVAGFAVTAAVGLVLISGAVLPRRAWLGLQAAVLVGTVITHVLVLRNLYGVGTVCVYCVLALALAVGMLAATTSHVVRGGHLSLPDRVARPARWVAAHPVLVAVLWCAAVGLLIHLGLSTGGAPGGDAHTEDTEPSLAGSLAAVALISAATVAGAWTVSRSAERIGLWLSIASAMMLVTALTDVLPDAWHESEEAGVPLWLPALVLVAAFVAVTLLTRGGHDHHHGPAGTTETGRHRLDGEPGRPAAGGIGAAAALTLHRVVEGATLALTPSLAVIGALLVHSASEGLALGALLGRARRDLNTWLAVSAAGPVIGLAVATVSPLPDAAVPVLLALVGGVLLRTAALGLHLAVAKRRSGELSNGHVAAAVCAAAALAAVTLLTH